MKKQVLGLVGQKQKSMCRNNDNKGNPLMELLLFLAIIVLFVQAFKAIYAWYKTCSKGQKKWFWVALILLYLVGLMIG